MGMDQNANCISCGSAKLAVDRHYSYLQQGSKRIYLRCKVCGLITTAGFYSEDILESFYPADYYGAGRRKFIGFFDNLRGLLNKYRVKSVDFLVRKRDKRILDIGCGEGKFLREIQGYGYETYGVELPGPAFNQAKLIPALHLFSAYPISNNLFPENYFGAITLWHVLEHLANPCEILSFCAKWLKTKGYLFVEVPNLASWQARIFKKNWFHFDPPRHLFLFTPESLGILLNKAGFVVVKRKGFSIEMGVFGLVQSALNSVIKPYNLLFNMLRLGVRCRGPLYAKVLSVLGGFILLPFGFLFAMLEALFNRGAVIRYTCNTSTI